MKCIKMVEGETIRRIKDKEAQKLVLAGKAFYVKKTDWRKTDPEWKKRSDALKAFEKNKKKADEPVVDLTEAEQKTEKKKK